MKNNIKYILQFSGMLLIASLFFAACSEDAVPWDPRANDLVISEYVETGEEFTQFNEIMQETGLNSLLAVRGPFTLFLPTNQAMTDFYQEKGITSHAGLTIEEKKNIILNHLIPAHIETGDVGLGALRNVNAIGDYLVTEFQNADIILNKKSKIVKRNIITANGVIHHVDKVIEPLSQSVFDILAANPSFSLFTEGIRRTNLKDTLSLIEFPFGTKKARTRFTVLAVADTTFNRYGITTPEQMIAHFTTDMENLTDKANGFYRYMEYHLLAETHYLNTFETRVYPVLSYDNNVSITVDTDYKLNFDNATKRYTGFYVDQSNYPAKNGSIHTINDLLPVFEPKPTPVVWETTDHFDIKQGDYFGKHYMRWFDGQNTFKNIKWEGDYLLYYWKNEFTGKLLNDDCLSMSGWWWCEVKTPKIMKGKYKITSNLWSGQIDYAVYVDGVNTAMIKKADPAESTSWGEFEWTETKEHTIRVVATSPGMLFWDTVIFTPIN